MTWILPISGVVLLSVASLFWAGAADRVDDTVSAGVWPWGNRVSDAFKEKLKWVAAQLGVNPWWLMAIIAFETGCSFRPDTLNKAGSGAVGLIQFLPSTARGLGTDTKALGLMTAERQLDYVYAYLRPYRGRMVSLLETYTAVYYPAALGRPADAVLQVKGSDAYAKNKGLDRNFDGVITKRELGMAVEVLFRRELKRIKGKTK